MPILTQARAAIVSRRTTVSVADRALPCCELLGLHGLIIAANFVTAKVTTSGDGEAHTHGIRASRKLWREFAQNILAACDLPPVAPNLTHRATRDPRRPLRQLAFSSGLSRLR